MIGPNDSGRVLVVDDDPAIRCLVAKLLERADLDVDMAADGAEALEKLQLGERYGVIVLDLMMPRVSGFEVLNMLKERRPSGLKCLIVMSAIGRSLRATDQEQVCAVVEKPFEISEVKTAVQACLAHHGSLE